MTVETFIQRLTTILAALAALVAARLLHHPTLARQIIPLWTYITHLPHRIERTLTHPPRPDLTRGSRSRAPLIGSPIVAENVLAVTLPIKQWQTAIKGGK